MLNFTVGALLREQSVLQDTARCVMANQTDGISRTSDDRWLVDEWTEGGKDVCRHDSC